MTPHRSLEGVLAQLRKKHTAEQLKDMLPDPFPFEEARRLFREPEVIDVSQCSFKWGEPDVEGLKKCAARGSWL
jgi:flap endonuclease-1